MQDLIGRTLGHYRIVDKIGAAVADGLRGATFHRIKAERDTPATTLLPTSHGPASAEANPHYDRRSAPYQ
jgi:hypothetical protein